MRDVIERKHYGLRTEQSYNDWISVTPSRKGSALRIDADDNSPAPKAFGAGWGRRFGTVKFRELLYVICT